MVKSMKKINLLDSILNIVCPIVQITCMFFVVFIFGNVKIEACILCFQLFLLGVQFFLPKLLIRFVMKKQRK